MPHLGTASAGLAEWRPEDTISLLLSRADASLYRAKRAGRNRIDPRVGLSVTIREMREALDTGAFVVLFQPIVDLTSGDTLAAEALVRWNHPLRGSINPADFIPLAEESGVIVELGRAVLEQACISVVDAEHAGRYLASITVNVAGRQLQQPDYAQEAFVRCTEPGRGAPIIASITALADALGLSTVAEGVEYPEQAVVLAAHGCHKGQGWLYGRPAFIDRLELPLVDGPLVEARSVDGPGGDTPSAATRRPGRPSEVRGPASR
jgi:EAL domain-containing protein (putative c-di-GMP-specific phosphodiesterase class I)